MPGLLPLASTGGLLGGGGAPQAPTPQQPAIPGQATAGAATNTGGLTALMAQPIPNPMGLPQNTVAWKAPDLANYDKQFSESLAASRAGIASSFQRAMEDVTAQESIANQAVATLPGQYGDIYNRAESRTKESLGSLEGALGKSGLGGLMTADQMNAPLMAALQGGRAGFESTVPLTQLGMQETFNKQRGAMSQARMAAESPLEEASREWIGRRAGIESEISAREMAFRQQEADREAQRQQYERSQQLETQKMRQSERQHAQELAARKQESQGITPYQMAQLAQEDRRINLSESAAAAEGRKPQAEAESIISQTGQGVTSDKGRAFLLLGKDPRDGTTVEKLRSSDAYKTLRSKVDEKSRKDPNWFAADPQRAMGDVMKWAAGKPWDRTLSILLAELEGGLIAGPKQKKDEKGLGKGGLGWWR